MSRSFQSVYPGSSENIFNPSVSGFGTSGLGGDSQTGAWSGGAYPSGGYPSGYQSGFQSGYPSGYPSGYESGFGGSGFGSGLYGGMDSQGGYPSSQWMRPFPYGPRRPAGTGPMYRSMTEGLGIPGVLNENDVRLLNASWNILKRRPDFAPKVFIR